METRINKVIIAHATEYRFSSSAKKLINRILENIAREITLECEKTAKKRNFKKKTITPVIAHEAIQKIININNEIQGEEEEAYALEPEVV